MDIPATIAAAAAKIREAVALVAAIPVPTDPSDQRAQRGFILDGEWLIEAYLDAWSA